MFVVQPAITVDGVRELRRELRQLQDKSYDEELKALHREIADEVLDRAEPNVPRHTGALRQSLRGSGTKAAAVGRVGSRRVPYAAAIHWGWKAHNIRARPFLQDAAAEIERDITERYDARISELLGRAISQRRRGL